MSLSSEPSHRAAGSGLVTGARAGGGRAVAHTASALAFSDFGIKRAQEAKLEVFVLWLKPPALEKEIPQK